MNMMYILITTMADGGSNAVFQKDELSKRLGTYKMLADCRRELTPKSAELGSHPVLSERLFLGQSECLSTPL